MPRAGGVVPPVVGVPLFAVLFWRRFRAIAKMSNSNSNKSASNIKQYTHVGMPLIVQEGLNGQPLGFGLGTPGVGVGATAVGVLAVTVDVAVTATVGAAVTVGTTVGCCVGTVVGVGRVTVGSMPPADALLCIVCTTANASTIAANVPTKSNK